MGTTNVYTPRITDWDVIWNGYNLGLVGTIDPSKLKYMLEPITRGTLGKLVIDHVMQGLEGAVSIEVQDINVEVMQKMCPWWGSGSVPLVPPTINSSLYQYAQLLTLHPHDLPAGTTAQDLNLVKTVPMNPFNAKRDGTKQDSWTIDFQVYPDLGKLTGAGGGTPAVVYGYIGAPPS